MKKLQPNPMFRANIFSLFSYWWLNDFFAEGSKRSLQEYDMLELDTSNTSAAITSDLEKNWKKEVERSIKSKTNNPSLIRAVVMTYKGRHAICGVLALLEECLRTAVPVLIAYLIKYFENQTDTPVWHAYAYAAGISVITISLAILHHQSFYLSQRIGWHMRASTCALMYKKTLRLSQKSLNHTTTGQIVNLGATDVLRFDWLPVFLHYLWIGPLQCLVVGVILWQEFGIAILAGMGVLVLIMILQTFNGKAFGKLRSMTAVLTDERIRLMNEVVTGMRIIKMYAWEKPFAKLVSDVRRKEVKRILMASSIKAFNFCFFVCQDKILTFVTLIVYVALGGTVTASKSFLLLSISTALRLPVGFFYPRAMTYLSESLVAISRIEAFFLMSILRVVSLVTGSFLPLAIEFLSSSIVSFGRIQDDDSKERADITLKCINVRLEAGKLLAVIGPVGAGKSSLLSAVLGELPALKGKAIVHGKIVYSNQVPWVFSGTLRENILFGEEYEKERYDDVISACCLTKDLTLLSDGDLTLIGERGVTLSGGQKARVSLARATYKRNADICLLDDPLSAVDTTVASHIFKHCICGLMKHKARILVTHQLQLLKTVDEILIFKEGTVSDRGTYDELQAKGVDFAALLKKKEKGVAAEESIPLTPKIRRRASISGSSLLSRRNSLNTSHISIMSRLSLTEIEQEEKSMGELIPEETREQGSIEGKVYLEYFKVAANKFSLALFFIFIIASHIIYVMNDWWLSEWAASYENYVESLSMMSNSSLDESMRYSGSGQFESPTKTANLTSLTQLDSTATFDSSFYLKVYAILSAIMVMVVLIHANIHFYICVTSGIHMHNKMFRAILRAPIRFFDTNPSGRILNRFSKDMGQIDELLPLTFMDFLWIFGVIISVLILTSVVNYFVIIVIIPLVIYFLWLRNYYLRTSRDIKRLEGTCRSPVFSLLSSTLQGLLTVRAFGVQNQFENKFHECQDLHSASWFLFLVGSRWFGLRLDLITATFVSTVAFFSVISASLLNLNPGEIGLILTYTASLVSQFQWGVRQSAEVENLMTSVERVQQYYRIPPEAADENPDNKPPKSWPPYAAIDFKSVSFSYYKDGPDVLQNIDLEIRAKEKIGVVGRTGAGKSSLISALFRLSELTSGEIFIDGIPITPLGLQDLRSVLSIIPQDPILFTGTMRRNIDPFNKYSDEDLWNALEQVQLKELVKSLPMKLNTELAESGSNLSVGQRQLVCLARAVLRKSKILVIDEATANVDIRTDRLIQMTIRQKFKQCTVITIAHRINTIIDSDKILVLDEGQVKEYDEPHTLLEMKDGYFARMVKSAGLSESQVLQMSPNKISNCKHPDKNYNIPSVTTPIPDDDMTIW
uniref:multidrug resistance-associated protein 4-like isoform X2 n=1 Tax=Styela clava TaxID=7725 RepID=UPI00193A0747|nr:multidrug resistance-associated protein 4-like isoform X2 [Styela clava]